MSAVSNLEMGCRGWQVLEIQETREWETRLVSSPERNHLHLMLHWERNLPLQGSCRFLEEKETNKKRKKSVTENPKIKERSQSNLGIHSPTLGDQAP